MARHRSYSDEQLRTAIEVYFVAQADLRIRVARALDVFLAAYAQHA